MHIAHSCYQEFLVLIVKQHGAKKAYEKSKKKHKINKHKK